MEEQINVKFVVPSFEYNGVRYLSKDVEAAALTGDIKSLTIIADLVSIGSGIVEVIEDPE